MKEFWNKYKGAIIGGVIAILILCLQFLAMRQKYQKKSKKNGLEETKFI